MKLDRFAIVAQGAVNLILLGEDVGHIEVSLIVFGIKFECATIGGDGTVGLFLTTESHGQVEPDGRIVGIESESATIGRDGVFVVFKLRVTDAQVLVKFRLGHARAAAFSNRLRPTDTAHRSSSVEPGCTALRHNLDEAESLGVAGFRGVQVAQVLVDQARL